MEKRILLLLVAGLLSACTPRSAAPDPGVVQTAIAQTVAANWTATSTRGPTGTPAPTWTPTPPDTDTPTPLPSNTPTLVPTATTDLRLINTDPYEYLLTAADLPVDGRYFIEPGHGEVFPPGASLYNQRIYLYTHHVNPLRDQEAWDWGTWDGQAVLEANGLVDGWRVTFVAGRDTSQALYYLEVDRVCDHVVLFRSTAGAQIMVSEYGLCTRQGTDYTLVEPGWQVGDISRVCTYSFTDSGVLRTFSAIEFSYRNIYHSIWEMGMEQEAGLATLQAVAQNLLARLEAAPLTDIVTYHP